ncbi:MAG: universal stress protein [Solirubrobacterales bacterium]|nr:universal stress protein [Solirubrobacterales bacterium]
MFEKLLVGVDGRQGGHDAIALARLLAAPGAAVTFGHVYDLPTAVGRAAALALPSEVEAAEQLLDREAALADLLAEPAAIQDSSVGRGLHRLAEQRGAELLVVGSCHRGMLGRVFLGDDTSRALNGAPCAVAIAPRGYAVSGSHPFERIGVGCDVSPETVTALQVARALGARHGSTIRALSVVSLQSIPYGELIPEQWPKIAGPMLLDELHRLSRLEGVEGDATYGDPGEELAAFSAELDLLVVGSRSYGRIGRLFRGSTSNYLTRRSRCPLLVLPRSASRQTGARVSEPAEATGGSPTATAARGGEW